MYASVYWVDNGSGNGLPPVGQQAIICNNGDLSPVGPLGTIFSEILIKINNF